MLTEFASRMGRTPFQSGFALKIAQKRLEFEEVCTPVTKQSQMLTCCVEREQRWHYPHIHMNSLDSGRSSVR